MEESWEEVARVGDIGRWYALLRQDCKLLERIDEEPFIDSPLHIAASAGCTHFALEILRLNPSFGRKLNPDGLSPLDLALRNGHTDTVKRLIKCDPDLIRVQGREGITPLHYVAAEYYDIHLLAEFLITCPASIKDSTIRGETAVHLAVINKRLEAFEVLHGWLQRTGNKEVLNWKDENGNAALHLAVSTNQPEILELLIEKIKVNEKNLEGLTALDIAMKSPGKENENIRKILKRAGAAEASNVSTFGTLADFLSSRPKKIKESLVEFDVYLEKGLSGDIRNALLVVAVLIATATYQAVLQPPAGVEQGDSILNGIYLAAPQPPGGVKQGDNASLVLNGTRIRGTIRSDQKDGDAGRVVMKIEYFYPFIVLNSIAFAASLGMIFALLPRNRYNMLLYISLFFLCLSYICSGLVISPETEPPDVPLYALSAALCVYFLIIATRLPIKRMEELPCLPDCFAEFYNGQELARSVFLTKYSEQRDS